MRSNLLVLIVLRSADRRALLSPVLERAGHKRVQASRCDQVELLPNKGVEADLVIVELSPANPPDINRACDAGTAKPELRGTHPRSKHSSGPSPTAADCRP